MSKRRARKKLRRTWPKRWSSDAIVGGSRVNALEMAPYYAHARAMLKGEAPKTNYSAEKYSGRRFASIKPKEAWNVNDLGTGKLEIIDNAPPRYRTEQRVLWQTDFWQGLSEVNCIYLERGLRSSVRLFFCDGTACLVQVRLNLIRRSIFYLSIDAAKQAHANGNVRWNGAFRPLDSSSNTPD